MLLILNILQYIEELMKVYLVGGAVRDRLLGFQVKERDWVVVGTTPQEMLQQGFKKVGRDFPVFLHPETHEEYALARTERKTGKGYTEFICYSDPTVTLEDDLKRRDLTINAIAEDQDGKIIDPYNGKEDLKKRVLRHVSAAFVEDPVRILRVARFAARFGDFKVHTETNLLMEEMVRNREVDALVPERVWQELERALCEQYPIRFFIVLKNCQVLPKLFPEIAAHLEEIQKTLDRVVNLSQESIVRFAAMMFNLDKKEIESFCKSYRLPNSYRELSLLVIKLKGELRDPSWDAEYLIALLERVNGYKNPERLKQAELACLANDPGLTAIFDEIWAAYEITKEVKLSMHVIEMEADKKNLKQILHAKRKQYLQKKTHNLSKG